METNELLTIFVPVLLALVSIVWSHISLTKELREANKRLATQLQHNQDLQTKQAQQMFFAEYTRRYQDIILHLPNDGNEQQQLKYIQLYFDLCSEEYHLHEIGLIDEDVWHLWVDGMKDAMKRDSFKKAWKNPLGQHYQDSAFISFVDNELMK